jgi:hypothetical protein
MHQILIQWKGDQVGIVLARSKLEWAVFESHQSKGGDLWQLDTMRCLSDQNQNMMCLIVTNQGVEIMGEEGIELYF